MPRRSALSAAERESLLAWPETPDQLIRHYMLSEEDLVLVRQHRGDANRLGFAVQLCAMRYPGVALAAGQAPPAHLLAWVGVQVQVLAQAWEEYGKRDQTRREHQAQLQSTFGFSAFARQHYRSCLLDLDALAFQTDKGLVLATELIERLRSRLILLPPIAVIERLCAESITRGQRKIFQVLTQSLDSSHRHALERLLEPRPEATLPTHSNTMGPGSNRAVARGTARATLLAWLRQPPAAPNTKHFLEHIGRLESVRSFELPEGLERRVHQNRLLKLAREGAAMRPGDLAKLEPTRRYATLVAVLLETQATLIDEIIDLSDRILGAFFHRARRSHEQEFQSSGREINAKLRLYSQVGQALLEARQSGGDPFAAIESLLPWEEFTQSVAQATQLARSEGFDSLDRMGESYASIRRYAPAFLEALTFRAAPAAKEVLDAVDVLRALNATGTRKLPPHAPTGFVKKRWKPLVFTKLMGTGTERPELDRRFYEICVLAELKNALRSGDIWVQGSRQFRDFEEYLLPADTFAALKRASQNSQDKLPDDHSFDPDTSGSLTPLSGRLPGLHVGADGSKYLRDRMELLAAQLENLNRMAANKELPDAVISDAGLKITPLANAVPPEADALVNRAYSLLPHVKITELLLEVEEWTGFTQHLTHIKTGQAPSTPSEKTLLLTAILADAINLGLTKMAQVCPGTTYTKLSWLHTWHIREETYAHALAELVGAQQQHPLAQHWGQGRTSSSDGQRFKVAAKAQALGQVNPKYGSEPGVQFYTHVSDQYSPFHTKVINVGVRDATDVLDGLLYHESDLHIQEHYTDTAGFTDHVFALMHLLGFRFAPRIRDLADKRLFIPGKSGKTPNKGFPYDVSTDNRGDQGHQERYPALSSLIGGTINVEHIRTHWDEILRLALSIRQGTVTASLMLRKLGSYPRQNGLALALRELGRIERTLFTLDWLQDIELRRRVQAGLNKGEARNALARAIFFNRLGEIRDRSFQLQQHRASGLNLVTAAISLWNTVYLDRALQAMREHGDEVEDELIPHLSPLAWEHINLTGDYLWMHNPRLQKGKYRPLKPSSTP